MKVYKFRGKSLETGKYVYGDLVHVLTAVTVDDALVDKDTVAQFIGYDCKDREVYDDDKLVSVVIMPDFTDVNDLSKEQFLNLKCVDKFDYLKFYS